MNCSHHWKVEMLPHNVSREVCRICGEVKQTQNKDKPLYAAGCNLERVLKHRKG